MDWDEEIGCEGGPVLVANADDFRAWTGSDPYPDDARIELLFYSPFTGELLEKFQAHGVEGHLRFPSDNPAELRDALMESVIERFPGVNIDKGADTWVATRPDGKKLHASLEPSSEYALALRGLGHDGVYNRGEDSNLYLWSVEPGIVRLSVREANSELLLSQITYLNEGIEESVPYNFCKEHVPTDTSGAKYLITRGPTVVAWSPNSFADVETGVNLDAVAPSQPGVVLNLATNASGASVWLRPGSYYAQTGYHETADWGVGWCLLIRAVETRCCKRRAEARDRALTSDVT